MEEIISLGHENVRNRSWIVEVNEELSNNMRSINTPKKLPKNRNRSVYRLPASVRENFHYSDYTPRKVSFGPYYHGHELCLPTEQNKKQVLLNVLRRSKKPLEDYIKALDGIVEELRDAYDELDPVWEQDTDAFLRLMIFDGCFLLEILQAAHSLRFYTDYPHVYDDEALGVDGVNPSQMEDYRHDMLLLENQLPMLLLVKLAAVQNIQCWPIGLDGLILQFILHNYFIPLATKTGIQCAHVLDVYRMTLLHNEYRDKTSYKTKRFRGSIQFNIPTATEFDKVGIGFTTSKTNALLDTSFRRRTLRLPPIDVDDATKSRMLNIIAFEQFHEKDGHGVTSYIHFMSSLLKDPGDVKLLQLRGIIQSELHNEEVAEMFYKLRKDIKVLPEISPVMEHQIVAAHLRKRFNKMSNEWRKDLFQTYLRSPWAIVSLVVAFLIFSLTIIQTVYTVLSYYNGK